MNRLLTRKEAAALLGFAPNTLAKWAMTGEKLPVVKLGRTVRYRHEDVIALIQLSTVGASLSDDGDMKRLNATQAIERN